tara:strand:+ start:9580 stop:10908 length:1329 start_codon:yes stop_codon:yes gene_type:complete
MVSLTAQAGDEKTPELETDDKPIRYIGLLVIVVTFVFFGGWSLLAPLGGAALAPGVVMVKNHRKTVQHLEGGIVRKLLVRDGDVVAAGDVLIELDDTRSRAELDIVRGQYSLAKAMEARLIAERDGLAQVVYPDSLGDSTDKRTAEAIAVQNQIFLARTNAHTGEKKVLEQRIEQLRSQIEGLEQLKGARRNLAASYAAEIQDINELLEEGFADNRRLREFDRNHTQNLGDIADLESRIAGLKINIGETQLQIMQLEKEVQKEVAGQLGETQGLLSELTEKIYVLSDRLQRGAVVAPVGGMVLGLTAHTEGGVIAPGSPIMDIVPLTEELLIEAKVSPLDIDRVSVGMQAEVRFSAFKRGATPVLVGVVTALSSDSLVSEDKKTSYYLARVELTPESLKDTANVQLVAGMPAEVLIKTADRTLFRYIAQPFSDMLARSFLEE